MNAFVKLESPKKEPSEASSQQILAEKVATNHKFLKRHVELFRVHFAENDAKEAEGVRLLLDSLRQIIPGSDGSVQACACALPLLRNIWRDKRHYRTKEYAE